MVGREGSRESWEQEGVCEKEFRYESRRGVFGGRKDGVCDVFTVSSSIFVTVLAVCSIQ